MSRARGVIVRRINLSSFQEGANEAIREQEGGYTHARIAGPWAVAEKDGRTYIIDDDGCGHEITEHDPIQIYIFPEREGSFSIIPTLTLPLAPSDIAQLPQVDMDLADHIRTFGDRLERNFAMWHETLA